MDHRRPAERGAHPARDRVSLRLQRRASGAAGAPRRRATCSTVSSRGGSAARKLGAVIDPVADKLFMASAFGVVAVSGRLEWYEILGVLLRDLVATIAFVVTLRLAPAPRHPRAGGRQGGDRGAGADAGGVPGRLARSSGRWPGPRRAIALYAIWDYYRVAPAAERRVGGGARADDGRDQAGDARPGSERLVFQRRRAGRPDHDDRRRQRRRPRARCSRCCWPRPPAPAPTWWRSWRRCGSRCRSFRIEAARRAAGGGAAALHRACTSTTTSRGDGLDEAKARRAIELSITKYCSVIHSLAPDIRITHGLTLG